MLRCEIWDCHTDYCIGDCDAVYCGRNLPTFQKKALPTYSEQEYSEGGCIRFLRIRNISLCWCYESNASLFTSLLQQFLNILTVFLNLMYSEMNLQTAHLTSNTVLDNVNMVTINTYQGRTTLASLNTMRINIFRTGKFNNH
jgi:hypothetical protein